MSKGRGRYNLCDVVEVHCCVVTMKGKLVSFGHSINFNRVQDVSIRRSSLLQLKRIYRLKRPVPYC